VQLDHIVMLVHDLEAACADLRSLGFTVQERADTKTGTTEFRFISFEDGSYILVMAFQSASAQAGHRLGAILAEGEGWADYSFLVPAVDAAIARGKTAGVTLGKVNEVTNVVRSGASWSLRLLVSGRGAGGDDALPFLVEDTGGRDVRIPAPLPHANGATGIAALRVGAADPAGTAARLGALLDLAPAATNAGWTISAGPARIEIVANAQGLPGRRATGGLVETWIAADDAAGLLDPARSHFARITLVARPAAGDRT